MNWIDQLVRTGCMTCLVWYLLSPWPQGPQRVRRAAELITGNKLTKRKAPKITSDHTHPAIRLFSRLPSDRRYHSIQPGSRSSSSLQASSILNKLKSRLYSFFQSFTRSYRSSHTLVTSLTAQRHSWIISSHDSVTLAHVEIFLRALLPLNCCWGLSPVPVQHTDILIILITHYTCTHFHWKFYWHF